MNRSYNITQIEKFRIGVWVTTPIACWEPRHYWCPACSLYVLGLTKLDVGVRPIHQHASGLVSRWKVKLPTDIKLLVGTAPLCTALHPPRPESGGEDTKAMQSKSPPKNSLIPVWNGILTRSFRYGILSIKTSRSMFEHQSITIWEDDAGCFYLLNVKCQQSEQWRICQPRQNPGKFPGPGKRVDEVLESTETRS